MRRFSSYGPVDPEQHFCVERKWLVKKCVDTLVGRPGKGGHFFTIWAPRQAGKTGLVQQAIAEINSRYPDRFITCVLNAQDVMGPDDPPDQFLQIVPGLFEEALDLELKAPASWDDWRRLFSRRHGIFDRPAILVIDEFDGLPKAVIDRVVGLFRKIYTARDAYYLHGLALVGVRAVLGATSDRGSPFNVQRALKVDNLTESEVYEMFDQYEAESGQRVEPDVRAEVFRATRGQPGLVSWFGELLTEKYNPATGGLSNGNIPPISMTTWKTVYPRAVRVEWNNNVLNLISKAREDTADVMKLFANSNVPFSIHQAWCNHLYLNGVIDYDDPTRAPDAAGLFCRFASPFVQECLYTAFTDDLFGARGPILALKPGDTLHDVFSPDALNLPPLLGRYQQYLERLSAEGLDPWHDAPRRVDQNITEAVGHFHLYAWLRDAISDYAAIIPEFPTGNGLVDLVIHYRDMMGVLEVKSFRNMLHLERGHSQAAAYARSLGQDLATIALFVHSRDPKALEQLSGETIVEGVRIVTIAIGWG